MGRDTFHGVLGRGRPVARAFVAYALMVSLTNANPVGGTVVGGVVTIDQSNPSYTEIRQSTDKGIINWQTFDIDKGQRTHFQQPSSTSHTLNRVVGSAERASQIQGSLTATGRVTLVNPNGVLIGRDAMVDTAGLIASTADISNQDFMDGKLRFNQASPNKNAAIINQGTITLKEAGLAAFVAPHVVNDGVITAKMGRVMLAGAETATIDLYGDGLIQIAVQDETLNTLVKNGGAIIAEGGTIHLTAASAKTLVEQATGTGSSQSFVVQDGVLSVESKTDKGGTIVATADRIEVNGSINADGKTGGGTVLIGGDYLGGKGDKHFAPKNIPIPTAKKTTITNTAKITANATTTGNGGNVIVWADDHTSFKGSVEAKGGAQKGAQQSDGGFVETSGKNTLHVSGTVDASGGIGGTAGTWLLDPRNVTITSSQSGGAFDGGSPNNTYTPTIDDATVNVANIKTALEGGTNVIITTGGTGAQEGNITWTAGTDLSLVLPSAVTLTLSAANSILFAGTSGNEVDITATGNALNLHLFSDNDGAGGGAIDLGYTNITTNGGNIIASGGTDPFNTITPGDLTDSRAIGTASNNDGITIANGILNAGAGNITVRGAGRNVGGVANGIDRQYGVFVNTGGQLQTSSGTISVHGTGGNGTSNNHGVYVNGTNALITSATGNVGITGVGGNGSSSNNRGIHVLDGGQITSTGSATLTINGTGGNGTSANQGVRVQGTNALITSLNGAVTVNGTGSDGSGNFNIGTLLDSGGQITSTGSATLTITGTGGNGTNGNFGVEVNGTNNSRITSLNGAVTVNGTGGNGSSNENYGTYLQNGGQITSTGSATLTINGTGGNGTSNNHGVRIEGTNARITSATGNVAVTGVGGNGSSSSNFGTYVLNGGQITSTGSATLTINGTGGNSTGGANNNGIRIEDNGTSTTFIEGTGTGAVTLNGTGGTRVVGGSQSLRGIAVFDGGIVRTNTSVLTLNGVGGNSTAGDTSSSGVHLHTNGQVYSTSGTLRINASTPNTSSFGLWNESGSNTIGGAGVSGTIEIFTDKINPTNLSNLTIRTTGTVTLAPFSSNSIGLNGGAGVVQYTSGLIDRIQSASRVIFGSTASGTATIGNNWDVSSYTFAVDVLGSSVTAGTITAGNNRMLLRSFVSDITLGGTITSTATGDAITLAASNGRLVNTAGSGALTATNGRRLVYTANPANDVLGGLVRTNKRYNVRYGDNISAFTGDYFFYAVAPTVTLTANAQTYTYNGTATPFSNTAYTATGFIDGDTLASLTGAATLTTSDKVNATNGTPRDISIAAGTLAGLGYAIAVNNTATNELTINKAALTLTPTAQSYTYTGDGSLFNNAAYTLTGFVNSETASVVSGSGGVSASDTTNAGTRNITGAVGSLAASNYSFAANTLTNGLTINKASLTLASLNQQYTYDGTASQFSSALGTGYSIAGLLGSDTFAGQVSGTVGVTASDKTSATGGNPRAITLNITGLTSGNYTLAKTESGLLTIDPASLTLRADNQSSVYGNAFNTTGFTYSLTSGGLISGDTLTDVVGSDGVTYTVSGVAQGDDVGTYANAISINSGTVDGTKAGNYTISLADGDIAITPASLTVTANTNQSKVYGSADPAGYVYTLTSGNLFGSDTFSGSLARVAGEDAGLYALNQGTLTAGNNYAITYNSADFEISKAALSLRPDAVTREFGEANPGSYSYSIASGQVFGSDVLGSPVFSVPYDQTTNAGDYTYTMNGLSNPNYAYTYIPGLFTISRAPVTFDVQDIVRIVGQANPPFTVTAQGLKNSDTLDVIKELQFRTAANTASVPGLYTIEGFGAIAQNYTISYVDGTLQIIPQPQAASQSPLSTPKATGLSAQQEQNGLRATTAIGTTQGFKGTSLLSAPASTQTPKSQTQLKPLGMTSESSLASPFDFLLRDDDLTQKTPSLKEDDFTQD